MRIFALVLFLLSCSLRAATPPQTITLDISETSRTFKLATAEGTTPLFRASLKNNGAAYTATGWTGTLYLSATWTASEVIAIPSTATGTTYVDFQTTALQTATPGVYRASFTMTDGTYTVEWQRGEMEIRENPGTDGATEATLSNALNWGSFSSYSGTASGPYRAGTNIVYTLNGDGSVNVNSKVVGTAAAGRILYGDSGGLWQALGAGSAGQVLQSNGAAAPSWVAAGGVSDGDKGDITVAGASWTIDAGAVTAAKIGAGAVTAVKLADADFGDWTVASGVATIDTGAITSAKILDGTIANGDIADGTIAGAKLATAYLPLTAGANESLVDDLWIFNTTPDTPKRLVFAMNPGTPSTPGNLGNIDWHDNEAEAVRARIIGSASTALRGQLVFQTADASGALQTALTLAYTGDASFSAGVIASSFSGNGASITALNATQLTSGTVPDARFPATLPAASGTNLTNLDATDLVGDIPAASFGEVAIDWTDRDMHLHTAAQVGWALYEVDNATRVFSGDAAKSANAAEQAFTFRTGAKVVPRGFVAFKTTGALVVDWIADSTTVADIRGITVLGYNPVTGTKTVIYSDSTTRNVGTINTPETVSINRSAFSSTVVPTHILVEIDGAVEDSMCMTILNVRLVSE